METKINVAAILKDKPQETKLYDLLYNIDVELDTICTTDTGTVVWCTNETDNNTTCLRGYSEFGTVRGGLNGLQILLPSKEMRDWNKFAWKKGDILVHKEGNVHIIFEGFDDDTYKTFHGKHYLLEYENSTERYEENDGYMQTSLFSKAKESDAQTYISTIEERLGGKLNRETLEIEKTQPEFKDGNIVFMKGIKLFANCIFILKGEYKDGDERAFYYAFYNADDKFAVAEYCNTKVHYSLRSATDSEKQQLFDALAKKGKTWDAEKKQIVDLKPKVELKPFDKVLCRNSKDDTWEADFFARLTRKEIDYTQSGKYLCVGDLWMYCIPYNEETAHLLGTTDDWKGGEG
ncbi:hypothetical protein DXD25_09460 [Prevotella sp. TF12-30]|uniref:hypothetical protein n=1 Tax=Prevotellaceae TaxID=171552 RepID=UPI000E42D9AF|nr:MULTISPECIES: hypothetical protein [Prevotellaceae]RGK29161.1 hypothetical protein DXD25_09460 [Prevotella sp. TF12-30]